MLSIAGVQMRVRCGDNRPAMSLYVRDIKRENPGVDLIFFSELCAFGPEERYSEPIPGPTTEMFCDLARAHRIWLIPGSIREKTDRGDFNTAPVIDPEGRIVARYRKMFPWRPFENTVAGDAFCVFEVPGRLKVGLCICYDQWFPEVTRQLTWLGAEVILCPTMTVTTDRELELVLSRAHAIGNQIYFFGLNGLDQGGNGQSVLIDPEGAVLERTGMEERVILARLHGENVTEVRENGALGYCQVLKSLRDDAGCFSVYRNGWMAGPGFQNLGPMRDKRLNAHEK
jgi:predicted amidohydrolase